MKNVIATAMMACLLIGCSQEFMDGMAEYYRLNQQFNANNPYYGPCYGDLMSQYNIGVAQGSGRAIICTDQPRPRSYNVTSDCHRGSCDHTVTPNY